MRSLVLSDHTAEMAESLRDEREIEYQQARRSYASSVERRNHRRQQTRRKISGAWRSFNILGVIWHSFGLAVQILSGAPKSPVMEQTTERERVWQSGNEGERAVAAQLNDRLGADWTLISGYRGPGGEVDQIVIGPSGAFALEVKNLNGSVTVNGDEWRRDKYDRYGNLVERSVPIIDRRGRSPSTQLNEAVAPLERFLRRQGYDNRMGRIIVLAHSRSEVSRVEALTVDHIVALQRQDLSVLLLGMRNRLTSEQNARLIALIQRDHRFQQSRSKSPGHGRARYGKSRNRTRAGRRPAMGQRRQR